VLTDLREPEVILTHPKTRALIDFDQPVGLLLVAILHFITDTEDPARILAALRDALPPGSYLALSHATGDLRPDAAQGAADVHNGATSSVTLRNRTQVEALFDGWELIEPGVVQVPLWRPEGKKPRSSRPTGAHATRPAGAASLTQDRSSTVLPLPGGADTTVTRAGPSSRPNSPGRPPRPRQEQRPARQRHPPRQASQAR
jgi:hypothetical protein